MKTLFIISLVILVSGCTNTRLRALISANETITPTTPSYTGDTYKISSVSIALTQAGTGSATSQSSYTTSVFFNTSQSTASIAEHCQATTLATVSTSAKACQCVFTWQEVNTTSGSSVSIPRTVQTPVTLTQPNMVACLAPSIYDQEIEDGTTIKITIIPGIKSEEAFTVTPYTLTKSAIATDTSASSFQDAQGRAFINILRYSCYDQRIRGMAIQSKIGTLTHPTTGELTTYPLASQFCVAKASGNSSSSEGCTTLPPPDYSSQSYYYNLFIRENALGDINPGNARYICPQVVESLQSNNSIGTQGQYWPLDSTFALSMGRTTDFPIGVVANTKTSNPGDPVSASTECDSKANSSGGTTSASDSIVHSCLGFAAKPNTDGTCPPLKDPSGIFIPTYRLRRFYALYPPIFDTDGKSLSDAQSVDTIYVLDRPVSSSTNPNPSKPYTLRGPKPCPFAYFDNQKIVNASASSYASTDDSRWEGKNIDGIQFPNVDRLSDAKKPASCSAILPILSSDQSVITLGTVNEANSATHLRNVYIRPVHSWAPHYEEDVSFEACAPLSNHFRDPPLHFVKNPATGNVSWCAEAYPTRNNNIGKLENLSPTDKPTGLVRPFTSHIVKNSASVSCKAKTSSLTFPKDYPAGGLANHISTDKIDESTLGGTTTPKYADQTCDRTVVNPANGITWPRFPLLAPPSAAGNPSGFEGVEESLLSASNESYACLISYDNNLGKTGRSTPTQGCCGANVRVWTGSSVSSPNHASHAHLEPDAPCLSPQY